MAARSRNTRKARVVPALGPERTRRALTGIMRVIAAALVLACLATTASRLAARAKERPRFLVDPALVMQDTLPGWVPAEVAAAIAARLSVMPTVPIFAPDFASRLRAAVLASSAWVDAVPKIEPVFPNRARLDLVLRQPVAAIDIDDRRYLLDPTGAVLHEESTFRPSEFPFPVWRVLGAQPARTPRLGDPFPDPRVADAVGVAVELTTLPSDLELALRDARIVAIQIRPEVTVAGLYPGEVLLRAADSDAVVRYGRAASYRTTAGDAVGLLEKPTAQKITHLKQITELFPGLRGLEEARLDYDRPMYRPVGAGLQQLPQSRFVPAESGSGS